MFLLYRVLFYDFIPIALPLLLFTKLFHFISFIKTIYLYAYICILVGVHVPLYHFSYGIKFLFIIYLFIYYYFGRARLHITMNIAY